MTEKRQSTGLCFTCGEEIILPSVLVYRKRPVCGCCFRIILGHTLNRR